MSVPTKPLTAALAIAAAVVLAACSGGSASLAPSEGSSGSGPSIVPSGSASAELSGSAAAPAAASSITVWTADAPDFNWPKYLLDDFTKATGIKVNFVAGPAGDMQTKTGTALAAKSAPFDATIFPGGSVVAGTAQSGFINLKPFIDNKALTPDSYNFAGFPASEMAPYITKDGSIYALPANVDPGPQIYYNKDIFSEAGISGPPQSWDDVLADAKATTNKKHAGICMQGSEASPNGYPVLEMIPYFLPNGPDYKSGYLGPDWKPLWNTDGAKKWAAIYAPLMQNYAPRDVASYDDNDCVREFQHGNVAMLWANALDAARLYQKSQNPLADSVGVQEIPCADVNPNCAFSVPFGIFINKYSKPDKQVAAWKFIEYITSAEAQLKALTASGNPNVGTRPETLTYAVQHAADLKIPADYLQAVQYASQHIVPNPIPPTPAFGPMQAALFKVLSQLITKQVSQDDALNQMQSRMSAIAQQAGLYK